MNWGSGPHWPSRGGLMQLSMMIFLRSLDFVCVLQAYAVMMFASL